MLSGEAGSARVRRVVDEDGLGSVSDLAPQVSQVDLPALLRQKVVCVEFHTEVLADGLAEWEARLGHKDSIADFTHDSNRVVECSRAAKSKEDIVRVDRVLFSAKFVSDGLAGRRNTCRLRVAVLSLGLDHLDDSLVDDRGQLEAIGLGGLAKTQIDHRFLVILGWAELTFQDLADWVVHVRAGGRSMLNVGP